MAAAHDVAYWREVIDLIGSQDFAGECMGFLTAEHTDRTEVIAGRPAVFGGQTARIERLMSTDERAASAIIFLSTVVSSLLLVVERETDRDALDILAAVALAHQR